MNDTEREQWIMNDEGLYDWWRTSRQGVTTFIRANRAEIDAAITPVVDGDLPAHHLKYGHLAPEASPRFRQFLQEMFTDD